MIYTESTPFFDFVMNNLDTSYLEFEDLGYDLTSIEGFHVARLDNLKTIISVLFSENHAPLSFTVPSDTDRKGEMNAVVTVMRGMLS